MTKYTEEQVRTIRLLKRYNVSTKEISEAMGIPESSVDSLKKYGLNPPRKSKALLTHTDLDEALARARHREQEEQPNLNQFDYSMYIDDNH
jgi:predicted XRE-type DNA-binding protein